MRTRKHPKTNASIGFAFRVAPTSAAAASHGPRWWKRRYGSLNSLTEMLADDDAVMDRHKVRLVLVT